MTRRKMGVMMRYKEHIKDDAHLMSEWNWEENTKRKLDPTKLTIGSGKKASWICSKGHVWDTSIYHRSRRGLNCPYCANKKYCPDIMIYNPSIQN